MPITRKLTQKTTRKTTRRVLGVTGMLVTLIAGACGTTSSNEPVTAAAPAPSIAEAERFVDNEPTVAGTILHTEVLHRSCREVLPDTVRCVWAETTPVHDLHGWGHDFVTQEFTGSGAELEPGPRVVTSAATADGTMADHLTSWIGWLESYHPELATAVTPELEIDPTIPLDDIERAYWEYMAFIGAISLCGMPGAPSCTS